MNYPVLDLIITKMFTRVAGYRNRPETFLAGRRTDPLSFTTVPQGSSTHGAEIILASGVNGVSFTSLRIKNTTKSSSSTTVKVILLTKYCGKSQDTDYMDEYEVKTSRIIENIVTLTTDELQAAFDSLVKDHQKSIPGGTSPLTSFIRDMFV